MKKSIAMRWVKALRGESRDGAYEQGVGQLVDEKDRFCCLGVLCNLHNKFDWEPGEHFNSSFYYYDGYCSSLPCSVRDWSNMKSKSGVLKTPLYYKGEYYSSLIGANDEGVPFSAIADHIEKHYKEL